MAIPAPTIYHYSIQNDFPNHKVSLDRLTVEVQVSSIITALDFMKTVGDDCQIAFKDVLSTGDKTTLDGIVATHSGEPLPENIPQPVQTYNGVGDPAPTTSDGRPIVLQNLFPGPVTVYYTGAGDDGGRGSGQLFQHESDTGGDTNVDWYFIDWTYLAGGGIKYAGAVLGDWISFLAFAPATVVTANGTNTGNCNCVGPGNVLIVPAAGNGAFDVDLSTAVPVPTDTNDDGVGTGYYSWSMPDTGSGTITPGVPGQSEYNLYTISIDLARFINRFPMLGEDAIDLTIPAIKPKKIFPQWKQRVTIHNSGHAGLKLVWYVVSARVQTT